MYNAIIFDLDLTLLNTIDDLKATLNYVLRALGFPERTKEEVNSFIGNGIKKLIERSMPKDVSLDVYSKGIEMFREYYSHHVMDYTTIYDGIIPVLQTLKSQNIKLCVASNKDYYAVQMLCNHFFPGLFDSVIGTKDGVQSKPCTDMIKLIKDEIGESNILYIGDSEVDAQTAINAKLDAVLVSWGSRTKEQLSIFGFDVIDNPYEILNYVKK